MSINLHIERLILDGLPENHAQSPIIGAALETELARLLTTGGLGLSLQSGGAWPSARVSAAQLTASKPAQIGQKIAQAVYQGIGGEQLSSSRPTEGRTPKQ
jgi:hypothetical protein